MEKPNVDDIFDDFEYKLDDKKEHASAKKEVSEDDTLKKKYQGQIDRMEKEKKKDIWKEEKPRKGLGMERMVYLAIIFVLVGYAFVVPIFSNGNETNGDEQIITASVVDNASEEDVASESEEEEAAESEEKPVVEDKKLSGKILIGIEKIHTEVVDADQDFGYMTKIEFIIENGKDEVLNPFVQVFVYDGELHESWETRSRGEYKGAAIESGETRTASIEISPKTFKNLDLKKWVRLTLNGTEQGFITSLNEQVLIS